MKRTSFIISFLVICAIALAVPATPHPIKITQSDGTVVFVRLHGDEYGSYYTTLTGERVRIDERGMVVADNQPMRRVADAESSLITDDMRRKPMIDTTFPKTGKVRSLVLLVSFKDLDFQTSNAQQSFWRLLNEEGYSDNGGTGSARDYFLASSMGQFMPEFDVYGPYQLSHDMAYYGGNQTSGNYTSHSVRAADMVTEACQKAAAAGVDFSQYDENNDGVVDNVFIYYAGYNEAEGADENTIWPHRSYIMNSPKYSGKQIYDYACTSELKGNGGTNMCGIGTFCHEFGHVLGLPDMYNTKDNSGEQAHYTVGDWDIMCSGSYNNESRTPPSYTAFERFILGWLTPEQLFTPSTYMLSPLVSTNTAYLISADTFNMSASTPRPNEYWLLENRQRIGWDSVYLSGTRDASGHPYSAIPAEGMLITHITYDDYAYNNNIFNNNLPLGFDIEEADNRNPKSSSSADTYPGTSNITDFIPKLNDGTQLTQHLLTSISQLPDLTISFHYGMNDGVGFSFLPETAPTLVSYYDGGIKTFDTLQLTILGEGLHTDSVVISMSSRQFSFIIDGKVSEDQEIKDAVLPDSTYRRSLLIRHSPQRTNCQTISGTLKVATTDGTVINQIPLTGTSPRPTYISHVVTLPAENITPYIVTTHWDPQADADFYYVHFYTMLNEPESSLQDFEHAGTEAELSAQGWTTNQYNISTEEIADGIYSFAFKQEGSYLQSPTYPTKINELHFWLSNTYQSNPTDGVNHGSLQLIGIGSDQSEHIIEDINIVRLSKRIRKDYKFSSDEQYVAYRFEYTPLDANNDTIHEGIDISSALIDQIEVTLQQKANYITPAEGIVLQNNRTSYDFSGLEPNTTYYYYITCSETKGCEEHFAGSKNIQEVHTLEGKNQSKQFTIINTPSGPVAYLPFLPSEEKQMYVYNTSGELLLTIPLLGDEYEIPIPTSGLQHGQLYLIKYSLIDKRMKRQDIWGKFIY